MTEQLDRRQFIRGTAVTGVGASWILAPRAKAQSASPERVVVGVMGLSRGRALALNFQRQPNVEVRYVCDVDSTRGEAAAKQLADQGAKAVTVTTDFRNILDDSDVQALVCAAPNHWHGPATILACCAGKHVYVEKPCCHNPHEGELMIQAARQHRRAVQMGTQRRSGPGTIQAIERLREGAIGRVYLARAWYNNRRASLGRGKPIAVPPQLDYELWQGPAPRLPYVDNRIHYNWHWFWHWGNGELGNNGVHTLDLCRWGLGVDYPRHVTSSGGRYRFDDDQETPDTHTVCFEFADKRQITWQGLSCNTHTGGFVTFYGEDGALDLESNGSYTIYDSGNKQVQRFESPSLGDQEHIVNFLQAIRADKPLQLNAEIEIGHKSTLLCHLGNIAQRTSRALDCDTTDGRIQHDPEAMEYWRREYASGWEPQVT